VTHIKHSQTIHACEKQQLNFAWRSN